MIREVRPTVALNPLLFDETDSISANFNSDDAWRSERFVTAILKVDQAASIFDFIDACESMLIGLFMAFDASSSDVSKW